MHKAIFDEMHDLVNQGVFRFILCDELPEGANAFTFRFVLAINYNIDGTVCYKARYFVGGHRDNLKHYLVHSVQSLNPT